MKIFVINLERSSERKEKISNQLFDLKLDFEIIPATDGKCLNTYTIQSNSDKEKIVQNLNRNMTNTEIACAMSHRLIYKKITAEKIDHAVILEDDVLLKVNFAEVLNKLPNIKNTVIKLDTSGRNQIPTSVWHRKKIFRGYSIKKPVVTLWMAWGYCIDFYAAKNILEYFPLIEFCADDWNRYKKYINIAIISPALVSDAPIATHSTIELKRFISSDIPHKKENGIIKQLKRFFRILKTAVKCLSP